MRGSKALDYDMTVEGNNGIIKLSLIPKDCVSNPEVQSPQDLQATRRLHGWPQLPLARRVRAPLGQPRSLDLRIPALPCCPPVQLSHRFLIGMPVAIVRLPVPDRRCWSQQKVVLATLCVHGHVASMIARHHQAEAPAESVDPRRCLILVSPATAWTRLV